MGSRLITVYTDGSSLGNPGPGGWSWWRHEECWAAGSLPHTTNQQAELVALLMALLHTPTNVSLKVISDSQYAVNLVSKWLPRWKRAGWRTASGEQVANLKIVQHLDKALHIRTIRPEFVWVRGHNGVAGNEHADRAAVAAAHAQKYGRKIPEGPGWNSAEPKRVAPAKTKSYTAQGKSQKNIHGSSSRDRGKSPGTVRGDGALLGARPEKGLSVMKCSSCGATLHPLSLQCMCTR